MAFSNAERDRLYDLLPAFIRERDQQSGEGLRALLDIVDHASRCHRRGYRSSSRKTPSSKPASPGSSPISATSSAPRRCSTKAGSRMATRRSNCSATSSAPRTVGSRRCTAAPPRSLPGRGLRPFVALRARADVAKTIYYRRRKGTLPMLEELARDVTGWAAHAVEYFELLGWTQWVRNHLRFHSLRTPDIRSVERMGRLDGAFDEIAHTVDVRPISQDEGWYNIRNIGFHLWRLNGLCAGADRGAAPRRRRGFPLFLQPARQLGAAVQPRPARGRRRRARDRAARAAADPAGAVLRKVSAISTVPCRTSRASPCFVDGVEIPAAQVICRNLSVWSQPATDRDRHRRGARAA